MARRSQTPSYRLHKSSGQGIVTLTDAISGRRKDVLLGQFDTQASRVEYARVLSEWEARGRRFDDPAASDLTVAELLLRFMTYAAEYYGVKSKEYDHFEKTIIPLTAAYPHKLAKDFGPADLKVVRQRMIDHHGWSRRVVTLQKENQRINLMRPASRVQVVLVVRFQSISRTVAQPALASSLHGPAFQAPSLS